MKGEFVSVLLSYITAPPWGCLGVSTKNTFWRFAESPLTSKHTTLYISWWLHQFQLHYLQIGLTPPPTALCSGSDFELIIIASHNHCRRTSEATLPLPTQHRHVQHLTYFNLDKFSFSDELKMNPSGASSGKTFLFTSESVREGHSGTVLVFNCVYLCSCFTVCGVKDVSGHVQACCLSDI